MSNKYQWRDQLVILIQTGALTFDRQYKKRIAHHVLEAVLNAPDSLFDEEEYDAYLYATEILDFEYGLFNEETDPPTEWVQRYFKWKQNRFG